MLTEALAHLGLMLSRFALVVQAAVLDSQFFDFLSPFDDGDVSAEVGVISCLPVHDALLFPKSKKEQGIRIMSHAFKEITGSEGAIKEE